MTELAQRVQGGKKWQKRRKAGIAPACLPANHGRARRPQRRCYSDLVLRVAFFCLTSLSSAPLLALVSSDRF